MAKKKYYLDLTDCKRPAFMKKKDPRIIPIRPGCFFRDFDCIEEDVPKKVMKRWKKQSRKMANKYRMEIDPKLPIGFDVNNLPVGAKIVVK